MLSVKSHAKCGHPFFSFLRVFSGQSFLFGVSVVMLCVVVMHCVCMLIQGIDGRQFSIFTRKNSCNNFVYVWCGYIYLQN